MTPAYSVWVMEYAAVPNYPQSGLIYGMHNQGTRKLPYCYVVIKGQGQLAMVDVGYNHKSHGEVLANTYGVRGWHPPHEVLGEIGIKPLPLNPAAGRRHETGGRQPNRAVPRQ